MYEIACFPHADVAQLAERLICNQQVIGSSPIVGFEEDKRDCVCLFILEGKAPQRERNQHPRGIGPAFGDQYPWGAFLPSLW